MNKHRPNTSYQPSCDRYIGLNITPININTDSYARQVKGKKGVKRIIQASSYSIDGLKAAYQDEAAFRQVTALNLIFIVAIIFMPASVSIKMILVMASFLSLIVELFNTGIEASVDHTSTAQHPLAKVAKDVGSAAQFLSLLLIFILWSITLLPLI